MWKPIAERNKEFSSMTRMEQRVAIAKDVIAQLDAKELIAKNGVYLTDEDGRDGLNDNYNDQGKCQVCAIGAAAVVVTNGRAFELYAEDTDFALVRAMEPYFSNQEMREVETMFENVCPRIYDGTRVGRRPSKEESDYRMRAVWQHIIDNNGEVDVVGYVDSVGHVGSY